MNNAFSLLVYSLHPFDNIWVTVLNNSGHGWDLQFAYVRLYLVLQTEKEYQSYKCTKKIDRATCVQYNFPTLYII